MWLGHTGAFTGDTELGNLYHQLDWSQIFGIWPTGDFRTNPVRNDATGVLIALVVIGAVLGLFAAWKRRGFGLLGYAAAGTRRQLDLLALRLAVDRRQGDRDRLAARARTRADRGRLGVRAGATRRGRGRGRGDPVRRRLVRLARLPRRLLAPNGRLTELQAIGNTFAGQGPTLENDYDPYGARHFLRKLDAEGASELRVRPVFLRAGGTRDDGLVSRPGRDRPSGPAHLPHARPAPLTRGEPAAVRLPARRGRPLLRGVAAAESRAGDHRAPVARRPVPRGRRPELLRRAPAREGGRDRRPAGGCRAEAEHRGQPRRFGAAERSDGSARRPASSTPRRTRLPDRRQGPGRRRVRDRDRRHVREPARAPLAAARSSQPAGTSSTGRASTTRSRSCACARAATG